MSNQEQTQKNMTLEQAKQEVYRKIQDKTNYREISQIIFIINDKPRKFGISEISNIKKEFEPQPTQDKDCDKALLFKLFHAGKSPVQAQIKTEFTYEFVKLSYEQFLSFERKMAVPRSFMTKMLSFAKTIDPDSNDIDDIEFSIGEMLESHKLLKSFTYPCSVCAKPIQFSKTEWTDFKSYLIKNGWHHESCKPRSRY